MEISKLSRYLYGCSAGKQGREEDAGILRTMASETKTHTRRSLGQDTVSDCETLQRTINRLRGVGIAPRGVYRFESHEEAERWQIQWMARIHARQSSKIS